MFFKVYPFLLDRNDLLTAKRFLCNDFFMYIALVELVVSLMEHFSSVSGVL